MIRKQTLFVLGAGASIPYEFPSGKKLQETLCKLTARTDNPAGMALKEIGYSDEDIHNFARTLARSKIPSIDTFLARNAQFSDIAKAAIAALLIACESEDVLFKPDNDEDWYAYLWSKMAAVDIRIDMLAQNQVSFITFNYDRSLECFLHETTKSTFAVDDDASFNAWRRFPIIHVYGDIGQFALDTSGQIIRPYLSPSVVEVASKRLRVVPEMRDDDSSSGDIRKLIILASKIIFLGFSFDEMNCQRIGLKSTFKEMKSEGDPLPEIHATTLGLSNPEVERARAAAGFIQNWHCVPTTAKKFLREHALLD